MVTLCPARWSRCDLALTLDARMNFTMNFGNTTHLGAGEWLLLCDDCVLHYVNRKRMRWLHNLTSVSPDDFMLLLCASLQRQIFEDENKAAVRIMAGDNVEICMNLDAASFSQHNPVPDFIHCR